MTERTHLCATIACALLTNVSFCAGLGFDPAADPVPAASMYIAPENALIFRMRQPDGTIRQFERVAARPGFLRGADGWSGFMNGSRILIQTPPDVRPSVAYCFNFGRLVWYSCDGKTNDLSQVASPLLPYAESPLNYPDPATVVASDGQQIFDLWRNRQRLQFPFVNPNRNGVFYLQWLLLGLALAFWSTRFRAVTVAGYAVALVSSAALLMTASRGAFLAGAVAVIPVLAFRGIRVFRGRWFWVALTMLAVFGGIWFKTHDDRLLSRGFQKTSWSNRVRVELAKAAPRMIADASDGWRFADVGHAYVNWYQPTDVWCLTGSMMNDHLTIGVGVGRPLRFAYVFGWLLVLALLTFYAFRSRNAVPLGMLSSMAVAATFNPVMQEPWLWIAPTGAVVFSTWRSFRMLTWRKIAYPVVCAFVLSVVIVCLVEWVGRCSARGVPVHAEGRRVLVNGLNPTTWIVDDGVALAGPLAGKDIREFYESCPQAPSVGYVTRVEDLPDSGIRHLVLAGYSGDAWLRALSGSAVMQQSVPERVTFISPPFPPEAVPPPLLSAARVQILAGEFIARYGEVYANPPDWVNLVDGCELYLLRWMSRLW